MTSQSPERTNALAAEPVPVDREFQGASTSGHLIYTEAQNHEAGVGSRVH
jgi:hypothetical protein